MRSYVARFNRSSSKPIILTLLFVALLGASVMISRALPESQKHELPRVKNETESFQLVSVDKIGDLLQLRLKNTFNKAITAYTISYGNSRQTGIDKILGNDVVAPGEIEEFRTPLANVSNSDASTLQEQVVTILVVVFDDRSSEGDFKAADDILNDRLGQKIQLKRINRLIRAALNSPDVDTPATLSRLKAQIASLPEDQEVGQSLAVHFGLNYMKQHVLQHIADIERWHQSGGKSMLQAELYKSDKFQGQLRKFKIREALDNLSIQDTLGMLKELNDKRIAKL